MAGFVCIVCILCSSSGDPGDLVTKTIDLGISLLRGGNTDVQKVGNRQTTGSFSLKVDLCDSGPAPLVGVKQLLHTLLLELKVTPVRAPEGRPGISDVFCLVLLLLYPFLLLAHSPDFFFPKPPFSER